MNKKIVTLFLSLIVCGTLFAGSPALFNGSFVKFLKDKLKFKGTTTEIDTTGNVFNVTADSMDFSGAFTAGSHKPFDIFSSEDWEVTAASSLTTGQNATFDNGGTLGGAVADETSSPLAGTSSFKYTTNSTTTNSDDDFVIWKTVTLKPKQKGKDVGITFNYTWDGSDDLIEVVIFDDTGNTVLTDSNDLIKNETSSIGFSTNGFVPSTSSALKIGFHHTGVSESSKILLADDIELSTNPFVFKNLIETQSFLIKFQTSFWDTTGATNDFDIALGVEKGSGLFIVEDSGGVTRVRALRDISIAVTVGGEAFSNSALDIFKDGVADSVAKVEASATTYIETTTNVELVIGEFLVAGIADAQNTNGHISISATATTEKLNYPR